MENDTKTRYVAFVAAMSILLGGCYTANMGVLEEEAGEQYQISVNLVDEVAPKITYVKTRDDGRNLYNLELIAHGDFTKHNGVLMREREKLLCFGFCPGIASWREFSKSQHTESLLYFGMPMGNLFAMVSHVAFRHLFLSLLFRFFLTRAWLAISHLVDLVCWVAINIFLLRRANRCSC